MDDDEDFVPNLGCVTRRGDATEPTLGSLHGFLSFAVFAGSLAVSQPVPCDDGY